jgi:cell division septal protein FtsQ
MPVAAPADKRFRRAQVAPAKKKTWRDRWPTLVRLVVALAVVIYGGYRLTSYVIGTDALRVSQITIAGNVRMSRGEVLSLLEGLRGANMLTVELDRWQQRLLTSPWVADAAIRRVFPGTVAVDISEREPLAIGRIDDSLYLLDHRGMVIDEYGPNYAELDLPIIDGLAATGAAGGGDDAGGATVDSSRAELAGRLLADLQRHPELARRVSQIDVTDAHDAVVILEGDTALVRVGEERFVERLQSYIDLVPALRERVPEIDYVDLRFDERVFVRPHGGKSGS